MSGKTYRILLVDDDESTVTVIQHLLSRAPFSVDTVLTSDAEAAEQLLHKEKFDALILDLLLPGMNGGELLSKLNEDPAFKNFPVLVNSVVWDQHGPANNYRTQKNLRIDVVPRPFDPVELIKKIQELLSIQLP